MTNEELLQQAKDQVAKAWIKDNQGFIYSGDEAWLHFTRAAWYDNSVLREMEVAALLAIECAREEGKKNLGRI